MCVTHIDNVTSEQLSEEEGGGIPVHHGLCVVRCVLNIFCHVLCVYGGWTGV